MVVQKTSFADLQVVCIPAEVMSAISKIESRVTYVPNPKGGYHTGGQTAQLSYEDCEHLNALLVDKFPQIIHDGYSFDHFLFLKYDASCNFGDYHWDTEMCQIGNLFININEDFDGGELHFPHRRVMFSPQKSQGIAWLNSKSGSKKLDLGAKHGSLKVLRGTKKILVARILPF